MFFEDKKAAGETAKAHKADYTFSHVAIKPYAGKTFEAVSKAYVDRRSRNKKAAASRAPCPFCKNTHEEEFSFCRHPALFGKHYWAAICSCGAQGPFASTKEEALEKWNRSKL